MTVFRPIRRLSTAELQRLVDASTAEGFRFVARLVAEWEQGTTCFAEPGEVLLGAYDRARLVAIGGMTCDPYGDDPAVGRLRHVYTLPDERRRGLGRRLVQALETLAAGHYRVLVLRTDTAVAARFYESLGYAPLPAGGTATHRRALSAVPTIGAPAIFGAPAI